MRYLKKFSEGLRYEEGVMEIVNLHLTYLLDEFVCEYKILNPVSVGLVLEIKGNTSRIQNTFKWSDVKYDFIPFMEVLREKYDINWVTINRLDHKGGVSINIDKLLEEETIENRIFRLCFSIDKK